MTRRTFEPGAILRIDVDARRHAYARMLSDHPYYAIYDAITDVELAPAEVVTRPVLFVLAVNDRAYRGACWRNAGFVSLAEAPVPIPEFFRQDLLDPARCHIVDHTGNSRPATPAQCVGLEADAVWDPEHAAERLRDHDAHRPNVHLENLKLVLP
jgi:hypothetical protein